jgi:hypothetical protein
MRVKPKAEQLSKARGKMKLPERSILAKYNDKKGRQLAKTFAKRIQTPVEESPYQREYRLLGDLNKVYRDTDPFRATWMVRENDVRREQLKRLMAV